ncbi:tetratricopeptide repeat protein [Marinobacter sp. TBZ242]|uniref:Tetratricopeptide repeat protein n=1 Tax=Marinobacter azerbaijanicus TaxID=3050455 RepID=A0ABT7I8U3_9GAMM|nr:tetratricopeptide repeat protein [Marinobacter sp. TBZ242]MDL0429678.1 tetratricopeptide repeat protein [Marinobacter sp. TBZ242]
MMAFGHRLGNNSGMFVLALMLVFMPVLAGATVDTRQALRTGLARFALDSGNPAEALRHTRALSTEEALLVRARALMATGNNKDARDLLEQLAGGQYYRGDASLLLADLVVADGEDGGEESRRHLEVATELAHGETRQQALYRMAELHREAGHTDRAGRVLASIEPGYWAALGYMNMAADFGRRDLNPSRALVALRVALAMSEKDTDSRRGQELRSRLLVRAGHLAHKHEDYDKAISFLEKVPLESYSTPQGLYLHGLALSAKGNHRAAMQSWHRARKYPLAYPGVANAWLGTGRGYDLSGYLGQAGEAYLAASASFETERVTLRKLADQIRNKGAYRALVMDARDSSAEWFLADSRTLTQPRTAYLLRFMEQRRAQEAVNRVADLEQLGQQMAQHEDSLSVFRNAILERMGPVDERMVGRERYEEEIEALTERISALRSRVTSPAQQQSLRGAASTLSDLKTSLRKLDQRLASKNQRLTELLARTDRALERVRGARDRAARLQAEAEAALDEIALAFVKAQDDRMTFALDRTEQRIAHLYEYLALQNIERGDP